MHHFFEPLIDQAGNTLVGYYGRVIDPDTLQVVPIFGDNSGTPISVTSGKDNLARTDSDGNLSFYVEPGDYHLDIYATDATTFIKRVANYAMNSTKGDTGPAGPSGPAENTYTDLATFKASDTANSKATLVGVPGVADGTVFWKTDQDYSDLWDDLNYFESDSGGTGAWVRQGADAVLTKAGWAGAKSRTLEGRARDFAHLFDFLPPNQHAKIIAGTARDFDAGPDIRWAIDQCSGDVAEIRAPLGEYTVNPDQPFTSEDGPGLYTAALFLKSGLRLVGQRGARFRIPDSFSTDAEPKAHAMFACNGPLDGLDLIGITCDMNGQNNPISPGRVDGIYNRFTNAHIYFSGTNDDPSNAARASNFLIERMRFINGAGVSCITTAQTNALNATLGKNGRIQFCDFRNNGLDTDDHSSVFGWMDYLTFANNYLENDVQIGINGGGVNTFFELHGTNVQILFNRFIRGLQGIWYSENNTEDCHSGLIMGNYFDQMKATGISFFGVDKGDTNERNASIVDNIVRFDPTVQPGYELKKGVDVSTVYGQRGVTIQNLHVTGVAGATSTAVCIQAPTKAGEKTGNIACEGVVAEGTTFRYFLRTNAANGLGSVSMRGGRAHNLTPAGVFAVAYDLSVDAMNPDRSEGAPVFKAFEHIHYAPGIVVDDRTTPLMTGVAAVDGPIARFHYEPGDYRGVPQGIVEFPTAAITMRAGKWQGITYAPAWRAGSDTITGVTSNGRYSIDGNQVTVNLSLAIGASPSFGAGGALIAPLPIPSGNPGVQYLGMARIFDASAGNFRTMMAEIDGTASVLTIQQDNGGNATSGAPVPLANGDAVAVQITYER